MRYRLREPNLRRLNAHEDSKLAGLLETPIKRFDEPGRVQEVRDDTRALLEKRDRVSLSHLYRDLKYRTNIEWYLSEQERRDLAQLDDVVAQYADDAVQPPLTPEFVESLQHYDSRLAESGAAPTSQPQLADDAVNVMTIHKSKGLNFPVVLLPRLTADEWAPGTRTYDALEPPSQRVSSGCSPTTSSPGTPENSDGCSTSP
jgi:DNA helicase-2/ATP-dependent DNA helicase PcrA